MNKIEIQELSTAAEFLQVLGGHGQFPDDIEARVREFDKAALEAYISACSEEHDCSSWGGGFPEWLWEATECDARAMIDAGRLETVRMLCRRAGGWFHWPDGASGPVFVPMEEWLKMMGEE